MSSSADRRPRSRGRVDTGRFRPQIFPMPAVETRMTLPLELAETRLLVPTGLDTGGLDRAFGTLLGPGIDFGDLYFQHARRESWTVEDGIVKDGAHSI